MSTSGLTAERHPEIVRAVAEAGHEINGHGWVNDVLPPVGDVEAEREEIRRCTAAITEATGVSPVGWTSPGSAGSEDTYRLLVEEGYRWCGDEAADDLPYLRETESGTIAVLPRTNMFHNDLIMNIWPKNPPGVLFECFSSTFDELYSEGVNGFPKWTEITLHAHMAGRPTLTPAARRCLRYAQEHDGVWFANRQEIAAWVENREGIVLGMAK
jgi:peptidoglycan/xylan/chitin deacetylase (PgdA/CDA1 family)